MTKKRRYGIMGGTFNPVHFGHLVTAEEAQVSYDLDLVIFMPAGHPPHKKEEGILPGEDRYLMTVIATASNPRFTVSREEIDRPEPSYTIETLSMLRKKLGPESELFFITGADAVLEILTWKRPEDLGEYCSFIAATRPGYELGRLKDALEEKGEIEGKSFPSVYLLEVPALAISSTDIRRRVTEGRSIRYLLPEGVANFIAKNGYYRAPAQGA